MYLTIALCMLATLCGAAACALVAGVWMQRATRKLTGKDYRGRDEQRREYMLRELAWIRERQDPDALEYAHMPPLDREVPIEMLADVPDVPMRVPPLMDALHRALFDEQNLTSPDFQLFRQHGVEFRLERNDDGVRSSLTRRRARAPVDDGPMLVNRYTGASGDFRLNDAEAPTDEPAPLSIWKRLRGE